MNKIELLSPAKNYEFGVAAINSGADAVYIGAPNYGARKSAANSITEIEKLVKYAHFFNASVYITINTLLYDNELRAAENLIYQLYNIGADAIIFQDFAILEMNLPSIKLFASTQTNNYNIERIKFLDKIGIDRIILARELSIEDIKEIRKQTKIELETFIFGALCVSLSGNCYLSRYFGNRSANRGECAQPCRNIYSLIDNKGNTIVQNKHLLSIKDLNLENYIPQLIDAGISSFKIEGRLKDIDYVTNVISYFRKKMDLILEEKKLDKTSSGKVQFNFKPDLENTFNRGFTEYFINTKQTKISSIRTPKFIGKLIGKVKSCINGNLVLDKESDITNGDGLSYFVKDTLNGIRVNKIIDKQIILDKPININPGTIIFRNFDKKFNNLLSTQPTKRKINIRFIIEQQKDELVFTAEDEDNIKISFNYIPREELALNINKQIEIIKNQLSKSGNSDFFVEDIVVNLKTVPLFKISELNNIRNQLLILLKEKRLSSYLPRSSNYKKNRVNYFEKKLDYKNNVINLLANNFYKCNGVEEIEDGFDLNPNIKNPQLMTTKYCIRYELDICLLKNSHQEKVD
ncbi:MAG TPA: U32 family peptidase, partial [Melioribacteraceae bacterium]|nr:U32 family peptidase [Melioribacteraceae bacterium]